MLAIAWLACSGGDDKPPPPPAPIDADGDGATADVDCDDEDDAVYPGARDVPYDGVDADCAGDDDFDNDGDGAASDAYGGTDCNDLNPAVGPEVDEVPYNGADDDCDPTTPDDDLDGDGLRSFEDCDDTDPHVFPGALEVAFDGVDQDCDGTPDGMPFGESVWWFTAPRAPRALDTAHGVALLVRADEVGGGALPAPDDHPVALLGYEHDLRGATTPRTPPSLAWGRANADPTHAESFAAVGDRLFVGLAWAAGNGYGYLGTVALDFVNGVGWFPGEVSYTEEVFQDHTAVATWSDGADAWVAGSGPAGVGYARSGGVPAAGGLETAAAGGAATFRDPASADTFVSCDAVGCASWTYDPDGTDPRPAPAAAQPWAGRAVEASHGREGELVWREGRGMRWKDATREIEVLAGEAVTDGDVVVRGGEVFAAAVVQGDLVLAHGPLAGPLEEQVLPVVTAAGRRMSPTGATLVVRDDALFLFVTATDGGAGTDAVLHAVFAR